MTPIAMSLLVGCAILAVAAGGAATAGMMGYEPMAGWMGVGHAGMGGACHMCAGNAAGTTASGTLVVMRDNAFQPTELRAKAGDTVTWRNDDSEAHTVTSDSGSELASPSIPPGGTWSHTFARAGTFDYHCIPHSARSGEAFAGMTARVVVT